MPSSSDAGWLISSRAVTSGRLPGSACVVLVPAQIRVSLHILIGWHALQAVPLAEQVSGPQHPRVGLVLFTLADVYARSQRITMAEGLFRSAPLQKRWRGWACTSLHLLAAGCWPPG